MAQFTLKVPSDRGDAKIVELLAGKRYLIGRLDDCDVVVDDALLSRRHCELQVTTRGAILRDLQSQNGTFLNGARVVEELVLPGDNVQIGRSRLLFDVPSGGTRTTRAMARNRENPFREELPPRMNIHPCLNCKAELSNHDLIGYTAFQSDEGTICLQCFCTGAGEFTNFGRFRLYRKIGSGGFATVYLAIHLSLQRPVAIKVFKEIEGVGEKSLQRFLREGRTGARLSHPNIVQYIDSGREGGKHFLAMEYVDGLDSRQRLFRAGFFLVPDALLICRQVADALHFAHEKGAVHRDIKPENLIFNRQGEVKVSDFGLAKFIGEVGGSEITESGAWVGTLAYAPPEQLLDSRRVDRRSDVYSVTATLFEFISGKAAFPGKFNRETVLKIQRDPPPIDEIDSQEVPPAVRAIFLKGMAKNPDERYQTGAELVAAMDAALESEGSPAGA